ncbi:MAG: hypothetical protein M0R48_09835 [Candidatus Omnitrophica bacterium]|nr:hypothetical protein [Candidatus Omnitrophota bacterium]
MIPLYTQEEFDKAKSRQRLTLKCRHCGKTFFRPKNKIQVIIKGNDKTYLGDFCSQICRRAFEFPPVYVNCETCDKSFSKKPSQIKKSKHNFCCKSCSCTYSNTHKMKGTRISKLEKWLATKLSSLYPNLEFHFNRKDAINSELDIYIPSFKLAFELNGIFHYEPIYGPEKLDQIQNNDNRKFAACLEQGIELCIIDTSKQKYFKETTSRPFLEIIQNIILLKLSRVARNPIDETT